MQVEKTGLNNFEYEYTQTPIQNLLTLLNNALPNELHYTIVIFEAATCRDDDYGANDGLAFDIIVRTNEPIAEIRLMESEDFTNNYDNPYFLITIGNEYKPITVKEAMIQINNAYNEYNGIKHGEHVTQQQVISNQQLMNNAEAVIKKEFKDFTHIKEQSEIYFKYFYAMILLKEFKAEVKERNNGEKYLYIKKY